MPSREHNAPSVCCRKKRASKQMRASIKPLVLSRSQGNEFPCSISQKTMALMWKRKPKKDVQGSRLAFRLQGVELYRSSDKSTHGSVHEHSITSAKGTQLPDSSLSFTAAKQRSSLVGPLGSSWQNLPHKSLPSTSHIISTKY